MTSLEILLEALKVYEIEVIAIEGNRVKLQNTYEVEVEKNKMYKLIDDGDIATPFGDLKYLVPFCIESLMQNNSFGNKRKMGTFLCNPFLQIFFNIHFIFTKNSAVLNKTWLQYAPPIY